MTTYIDLNINRCTMTQRQCIVCHKSQNLVRFSPDLRTQVFLKRQLFVPPASRCCKKHLFRGFLKEELIDLITVQSDVSVVNSKTFEELLCNLRKIASKKGLYFNRYGALNNKDYYNLTGVMKGNFDSLAEYVKDH